jgi:hypothetical protein
MRRILRVGATTLWRKPCRSLRAGVVVLGRAVEADHGRVCQHVVQSAFLAGTRDH